MIKADLVRNVYETHGGISYREAERIVDLVFDLIRDELTQKGTVKLSGFGSFRVLTRKGRVGRNPNTGEKLQLAPSRFISFRPSRQAF